MKGDKLKLHIAELKHKHHHLELEINKLVYLHGDELKIQELKKRKLKLKDEIELQNILNKVEVLQKQISNFRDIILTKK